MLTANNRHPAKVFKGDAGSYFLGFLLGVLLLHTRLVRWRVPQLQMAIALTVLALPFFDIGMVIVRRGLRGGRSSPATPIAWKIDWSRPACRTREW